MTRKLAYIARIEEVIAIEGADRIVQYRIGGWRVIDQKDKYAVGDLVVYCECDSWMPNTLAPFLTKADKYPKNYKGIDGERLKTIKLKGALSQGLLLPISKAYEIDPPDYDHVFLECDDVTELLGIIKWEPEPERVPVNAMGSFPSFIPKTDQERIQNFMRSVENYLEKNPDATFTIEEKAEGSSVTVFQRDGDFGICSRNLRLKLEDQDVIMNSPFTQPAFAANLKDKLASACPNIALQFEVIGPAVQGNYYNLGAWEYRLFDVYDIDTQKYYTPKEMRVLANFLQIKTVPILETDFDIRGMTSDDFLNYAASESSRIGDLKNLMREGVVFKSNKGDRFTFKAVSNSYLLKRGY
jgi:RNA ligase (TIGR02306 family)